MAETDKIPFYPKLFRTKATYEAKLAAGEIEEGSLCFIEDTKEIIAFGYGYGGSTLTIDTELSDTSENPVQNKIIKSEIDTINSNIIENEEVTAAALINLDERINTLSENIQGEAVTRDEFDTAIQTLTDADEATNSTLTTVSEKVDRLESSIAETYATKEELESASATINETIDNLTNEILNNEEVTATALIDLDTRINEISENVSGETATKEELQQSVDSLTAIITDNEEVVAAALTDLNSQMENKQDALVSGNTIKTINGESILGEGNIEIQGGGGVELLEIRYNWDGTELTDEDKAVNAATYSKVVAGGDYVFWSNCIDYIIYGSIMQLPYEEHTPIIVGFESKLLQLMQINSTLIGIEETGNIDNNATISLGVSNAIILEFNNITTSTECFDYLRTIFGYTQISSLTSENIYIYGPADTEGVVIGLMLDTLNNTFLVQYYNAQGTYTIWANSSSDNIIFHIANGGICYLGEDITDEYKLLNTYLTNSPFNQTEDNRTTLSAKFISDDTIYAPVSLKPIIANTKLTAYQITIYRNSTFETWQINSDGTTQQITQ